MYALQIYKTIFSISILNRTPKVKFYSDIYVCQFFYYFFYYTIRSTAGRSLPPVSSICSGFELSVSISLQQSELCYHPNESAIFTWPTLQQHLFCPSIIFFFWLCALPSSISVWSFAPPYHKVRFPNI